MKVEVSNGELYDKHTILQIKKDKGLPVDKELKELDPLVNRLLVQYTSTEHLYEVLLTINEQLWSIEDTKRRCEQEMRFDDEFIQYSRLVYLLNDQRASVKRNIDALTKSVLMEHKLHNGDS